MNLKRITLTLGKLIAAAVAYFAGTILGGLLAAALNLPLPQMPPGANADALVLYQVPIALIFGAALALLARGLSGSFLARWLILAVFSWIAYSLNTYLEAAIFTAYEAASVYTLVMQLLAVLASSAIIAWLFPPGGEELSLRAQLPRYWSQYSPAQWAWRLTAVLLAFPLIYTVFGLLVRPFIITYYEEQMAGLTAPGWDVIAPTLLLRSMLFLLACLPVLIAWQQSRLSLFVRMSATMFILVGGLYMLQSSWLPAAMRIGHSLEILADSTAYTAVLVSLLLPGTKASRARQSSTLRRRHV